MSKIPVGSGTRRVIAAVLVVEDDVGCREAMRALLEDEGYRVLCAENGVEALAAMRSEEICVVLLDARMPLMDGAEFRRRQCDDPALRDVPVVLVTADRSASLDEAVAVLRKPFDADELLAMVGRHMCERAARADEAGARTRRR